MVARFPNLRVVLMSATIDIQMFHQYFNLCPTIEIEGRSFPIQGNANIYHYISYDKSRTVKARSPLGEFFRKKVGSVPTFLLFARTNSPSGERA
jgi:HrpA-like RNA helicase